MQKLLPALIVLALLGAVFVGYMARLGGDALSIPQEFQVAEPIPLEQNVFDTPPTLTVDNIQGSVEVRGADGEWKSAADGQVLPIGSGLRTKLGARANLRRQVGNRTIAFGLSGRADVSLHDMNETETRLVVAEGVVIVDLDPATGHVVELAARLSDVVARTSGGRLSFLTDGKGNVQAAVEGGEARVQGGGKTVHLQSGEYTTVRRGEQPDKPLRVPRSLLLKVRWPKATRVALRRHTIRGVTTPGALVQVGEVMVRANAEGAFSATVKLNEGKNRIHVHVLDMVGRSKRVSSEYIELDTVPPKTVIETGPDLWKGR